MGKASIKKPAKLAEKLLSIRNSLNLSQNELIRKLGFEDELTQSQISAFEREARIPALTVLLAYARLAGISTDYLIDDDLNLPLKLPVKPKNRK